MTSSLGIPRQRGIAAIAAAVITSLLGVGLVAVLALSPMPARAVDTATTGPACGPNQTWIGFFGDGVACMDDSGIKLYNKTNSAIRIGQTHAIEVCATGTTWIADSGGLVSTDGTTWNSYQQQLGYKTINDVACLPGGDVWLAGYDTIGKFDGNTLTAYPVASLGTAQYSNQVQSVAVAPNGTVWVATARSVARYNGTSWTYWQKGKGFSKDVYPRLITVDRKNTPWMVDGSYLYRFSGSKWVKYTQAFLYQAQSIAVDTKNRVWVGTYAKGVSVWNGKTWRTYRYSKTGLPSNNVKSLAADTAGRIWFGTDFGLGVLTGTTWRVYRMYNANLADNELYAVAVKGRGPVLPAYQQKATGKLIGRLLRGTAPIAGAKIEVCVQYMGFMFFGPTPCSDQVYYKLSTTASDGRFSFTLPAGKYGLTFKDPKTGKWTRLTDGFRIGDKMMLVTPSQTNDIGDIDTTAD